MTVESRGTCKICGEHISVKGNFYNQLFIDELLNLKLCIHLCKKHKCKYPVHWILEKAIVNLFSILLKSLLQIFIWVIWIVTYPFWLVHEIVN